MEACESLDGLESCARARSPSARGESGRLHYWWRGSEACIINHTVHALPGSRVVLALQPREGRKKGRRQGLIAPKSCSPCLRRVTLRLPSRRIAIPGHDIDVVSVMMQCREARPGTGGR